MIQRLPFAALPAARSILLPALAVVLSGFVLCGFADAARAGECLTVKDGTAREIGRFKSGAGEKSYCVYARAGQTMKVTITPLTPDMPTLGHIVFPSRQEDGGPGGVVFDDKLSEEGRYEIHVGRRFEKKAGAFELSVELK
jgi:hypothetical protein